MICVKCNHHLFECACPDAAKRIRAVLASRFVYVTPQQRARYEQRIAELEAQEAHAE